MYGLPCFSEGELSGIKPHVLKGLGLLRQPEQPTNLKLSNTQSLFIRRETGLIHLKLTMCHNYFQEVIIALEFALFILIYTYVHPAMINM